MQLKSFLILIPTLLLIACTPKEESGAGARDGLLPPEPLPEIDARTKITPEAEPVSKAQLDAAARMEKADPSLKIEWNQRTGTPRRISSTKTFLTQASDRSHPDIVRGFVAQNQTLFGISRQLADSLVVRSESVSEGSPALKDVIKQSLVRVELAQTVRGRSVYGAKLLATLAGDGRLASVVGELVPNVSASATVAEPTLSATEALEIAGKSIQIDMDASKIRATGDPVGEEQRQTFAQGTQFNKDVLARLLYFPVSPPELRLAWEIYVGKAQDVHHYHFVVDAVNGDILLRRSVTLFDIPRWFVYAPPTQNPAPLFPGPNPPDGSQGVLIPPTLIQTDGDPAASPNGWLGGPAGDPDGWIVGVTATLGGNNAIVLADIDANGEFRDVVDPIMEDVNGVQTRTFRYPADFSASPLVEANMQASVVNAFYTASWFHDRMYSFGFDEQAGNHQMENVSGDGVPVDPLVVIIQSQADIAVNNPFLYPAVDGSFNLLNAAFFTGPEPDRDAAFDQHTFIHELTHALTTRIVGGPDFIGLFDGIQARGMNEGYSDWYAMALLTPSSSGPNDLHAVAGWGSYHLFKDFGDPPFTFAFEDNYHYGLRRYPYSTFIGISPLTFADIDPAQFDASGVPESPFFPAITAYIISQGGDPIPADEVHNVGEIWALLLWEVRANLMSEYGTEIGNELALQLVTDSLFSIHQQFPTFTEARDALLLADSIRTGGQNHCHIWWGFAKRGLGINAQAPVDGTANGVVENRSAPFECGSQTGEYASTNGIGLVAANNSSAELRYLTDGSAYAFGSGDIFSYVPIQLPHEATITRLKCVVADETDAGYIQVSLLRGPINVDDGVTGNRSIANTVTFPTPSQPGFQELVGTANAERAKVNNSRYGYFLRVDFLDNPSGSSAVLKFRGCAVEFEV